MPDFTGMPSPSRTAARGGHRPIVGRGARIVDDSRRTVSTLFEDLRASVSVAQRASRPPKSGVSTSTPYPGRHDLESLAERGSRRQEGRRA